MKVYTNKNNTITLKILVSAEISGKDVELEIISPDGPKKKFCSPKRLPVLELDSNNVLFCSNVAASFVFPPSPEFDEEVQKWLNWEAVQLQPLLVNLGSKSEASTSINSTLNELENALKSKSYLVQDKLSVADICLTVALYPLLTEEKLNSQYLSSRPSISQWVNRITSLDQFKKAEKKLNSEKGLKALQSVASASWYPASVGDMQMDEEFEVNFTEEELLEAVAAYGQPFIGRTMNKQKFPVLPVPGEKNVLVTSALPYVNNVPHLGNIIGCVLSADVFARYCRGRGWNTLYVCGTDEYGTATETKAIEEGLTPQQICDKYYAIHRDVYKWFSIDFDYFGRTTTPQQKEIVQQMFTDCYKNGFTLTKSVDQLLCQKCDRYLADRFVEGICPNCKYEDARGDQCDGCGHLINAVELINPRCKQCQSTPVIKKSQQIFLDLPKIESELAIWVEKGASEWSHIARVITETWLKEGLKPRCITRDLKWGIPVPLEGFENKVFYVWFDAPIGYMSMTKIYTDQWLQWWKPNPGTDVRLYQFMAKDNVPFHSIMFPATLLASRGGYTMLNHLYATEYLNYENGKFSKSRGIGVFGNDAKDTGIPSDIFRFYLLYMRPESHDTNFSWADLATKNNTELLNNLGNFILRSLSFSEKFFSGKIPPVTIGFEERQLLGKITVQLKNYISALDAGKLREGIKYILNLSRLGNQYMQSLQPWVLIKGTDEDKVQASTVIGLLCNVVCLIASLLQPYMPNTVSTISQQVQLPLERLTINKTFQPYLPTGHQIGKPSPLFSKIEDETVDVLKKTYAGAQKSQSPEPKKPVIKVDGSNTQQAITALEEAIATQGNLVRKLKASGKSKTEVKPMIDILLDLKKQLAEVQKISESLCEDRPSGDVASLEEAVTKQGDVVRSLKAAGKSKDELQPEVAKLLALKKDLAVLKGEPEPPSNNSKSKKKK